MFDITGDVALHDGTRTVPNLGPDSNDEDLQKFMATANIVLFKHYGHYERVAVARVSGKEGLSSYDTT